MCITKLLGVQPLLATSALLEVAGYEEVLALLGQFG
jgi:hypothetical protein